MTQTHQLYLEHHLLQLELHHLNSNSAISDNNS